jgi:hypothetical protein
MGLLPSVLSVSFWPTSQFGFLHVTPLAASFLLDFLLYFSALKVGQYIPEMYSQSAWTNNNECKIKMKVNYKRLLWFITFT